VRRGILIALMIGGIAAGQPPVEKILRLFVDLTRAQTSGQKVRFRLTEAEVNTYLVYSRQAHPRPGLDRMSVRFLPGNYISTVTVVDFDMVEAAQPGTVPAILRPVLSGKRELGVDVSVRAENGLGTYRVEKATFEGVPLPAFLVEKMIEVLGARQPEKFDTTKPVPLPFGLRSVRAGEQWLAGEN